MKFVKFLFALVVICGLLLLAGLGIFSMYEKGGLQKTVQNVQEAIGIEVLPPAEEPGSGGVGGNIGSNTQETPPPKAATPAAPKSATPAAPLTVEQLQAKLKEAEDKQAEYDAEAEEFSRLYKEADEKLKKAIQEREEAIRQAKQARDDYAVLEREYKKQQTARTEKPREERAQQSRTEERRAEQPREERAEQPPPPSKERREGLRQQQEAARPLSAKERREQYREKYHRDNEERRDRYDQPKWDGPKD